MSEEYKTEDEKEPEQAVAEYGYETPVNSPIHNIDKSILPSIQGDPDPANPFLSNPSLLPQTPVQSEEDMAEQAQADEVGESEDAPEVSVGDTVTYVTSHGAQKHAIVTDVPEDGDVTLHVFLDFADRDYQEVGPLGLYHGVPYSSKSKPSSWHK